MYELRIMILCVTLKGESGTRDLSSEPKQQVLTISQSSPKKGELVPGSEQELDKKGRTITSKRCFLKIVNAMMAKVMCLKQRS